MIRIHVTRTRPSRRRGWCSPPCSPPRRAIRTRRSTSTTSTSSRPEQLNDKSALPTLRNGVLSTFQLAFSGGADLANGGHEGQATMSGLLADEFMNAESFPDRISVDMRDIIPSNLSLVVALSRPEPGARDSGLRIVAVQPPRCRRRRAVGGAEHRRLLVRAVRRELLLGRSVQHARQTPAASSYGDPQTRDQVLTIGGREVRLGHHDRDRSGGRRSAQPRARGQGARAARPRSVRERGARRRAPVPTSFAYLVRSSANSLRQNNGIWNYTANTFAFSVPDREGGNGLPYLSAGGSAARGRGDGPARVRSRDAVQPAAQVSGSRGGRRARVGHRGASHSGGSGVPCRHAGPGVRDPEYASCAAGLGALTDPGSEIARTNLLFRERAFWLWGTAHRLGDMRRLIRQYARAQNTVFPTGEYHKGGEYGSDVNFPVSSDERNNPKFTGCIDRSA